MFRQLANLAFTGTGPRTRSVLYKKSAITVAIGVSGTLYYTSRTIHADGDSDGTVTNRDINHEYRELARDAVSRHQPILDFFNRGDKHDRLREYEASGVIQGQGDVGVARFDTISVSSTFHRHDAHAVSSLRLTTGASWTFFGLFDGYNGHHTSDFLSNFLIPEVLDNLIQLCSKYEPPSNEHTELGTLVQLESETTLEPLPEAMIKTIKNTFQGLDDTIVNNSVERVFSSPSKNAARVPLSVAQSGSSALLAFFDSDSRLLRIALTGNSRAILGRRSPEQKQGEPFYEVHVLTTEQDAHNQTEKDRLIALHPNENVIENGRVLGSGVSRAFGHAMYKWSREIQDRLHSEYLGDRPPENIKTPPYITAEPEITTIEVKSGDFLVMASNGLWNCLTNEEAVGLVGLWLNKGMNAVEQQCPTTSDKHLADDAAQVVVHRDELPVSMKEDSTVMYRRWHAEKRFLCADDNAAGHLARNALGGADRDLTAALLSMTPPRSLRYRDDLSATVVFFDGD